MTLNDFSYATALYLNAAFNCTFAPMHVVRHYNSVTKKNVTIDSDWSTIELTESDKFAVLDSIMEMRNR